MLRDLSLPSETQINYQSLKDYVDLKIQYLKIFYREHVRLSTLRINFVTSYDNVRNSIWRWRKNQIKTSVCLPTCVEETKFTSSLCLSLLVLPSIYFSSLYLIDQHAFLFQSHWSHRSMFNDFIRNKWIIPNVMAALFCATLSVILFYNCDSLLDVNKKRTALYGRWVTRVEHSIICMWSNGRIVQHRRRSSLHWYHHRRATFNVILMHRRFLLHIGSNDVLGEASLLSVVAPTAHSRAYW